MHIIYIFPAIIQNKSYAPGLALDRRGVSSTQIMVALGPPITRGPPPHTLQSPPRTPTHPRSQTPPTRILHACNDDATLNIKATTVLKVRIHLLSH